MNIALRKRTIPDLKWLRNRHGVVTLFFILFLVLEFATRLALLIKAAPVVSWDWSLLAAFGWGFLYDVGAGCWFALPCIVILTFLSERFFRKAWGRFLTRVVIFFMIFLLLFGSTAEWFFWHEFGARFNFIAVDYLVYTHEVVHNIIESYPIPFILSLIAILALVLQVIIYKASFPTFWFPAASEKIGSRFRVGGFWCIGVISIGLIINQGWLPDFNNNYNRELSKNGIWSLFAAFKHNELDFMQFFPTISDEQAFQRMREEIVEDGSVLLKPEARDTLRFYHHDGPELKPNVIQITVESLSYEFLHDAAKHKGLTPFLSELESKSLVFDNFYATGTRTDRGMEALALSIPPTPGRSLIKRPNNEGLFTLGSLFRAKGYETAFIYGGYGYFDNMNYFFGKNGYRVIDRNSMSADDVTFANAWGACDEDLYRWTIREADSLFETKKPFHFFLMTTSNHRPFTYPDGRIDLPSKTSERRGGVKYTDYAIGKFLRDAESKPWFKNTIFIIVADHCASSAGKSELTVEKYHIPLIIYSPGGLLPKGHVQSVTSQMDFAPTLLGLLNWSYPSRFFGHDVLNIDPKEGHALIGNYQKVGHIEEGKFVLLKPVNKTVSSHHDFSTGLTKTEPLENDSWIETISYYQVANYLYKHSLYRALTCQEFNQYVKEGKAIIKKNAT